MPPATYVHVVGGNHRYNSGDFVGATISYSRAVSAAAGRRSEPPLQRVAYNLGNAYYSVGEPGPALETLAATVAGLDAELAFRSYFNLGYMEYQRGRYEAAADHFVAALSVRPGDHDAKINLEITMLKLQGGVPAGGEPTGATEAADQAIRILEYIHTKEEGVWESLEPDADRSAPHNC
jgi:tetratricopeptide (TPR) repeat protein